MLTFRKFSTAASLLFYPILFALRELKYFPFIKRTILIYKHPEIPAQCVDNKFEFFDFCLGLALSQILAFFILGLFSTYFEVNFEIINIPKLVLVVFINAFSIASLLTACSLLLFKILKIKFDKYYIATIFWRTIRLMAIFQPLLTISMLVLTNNVLKYGELYGPSNQEASIYSIIFSMLIGFTYIIALIFLTIKLLFSPLYKIFIIKGKLISIFCLFVIFAFTKQTNSFLSDFISIDVWNKEKTLEAIKNSSFIMKNKKKHCNVTRYE